MHRLPLVLLLAAAACGDDGGNNKVDAGSNDIDAKVFEDAPSVNDPVKITVKYNGAAKAGVRIHFQNPDSTLIASADTDSNGVASAMMPNGGWVTAVNPFAQTGGPSARLWTYGGVQPGDDLQLADSQFNGSNLAVTTASDAAGTVTGYLVGTPCNQSTSSTTAVDVYIDTSCKPTTDAIVASLDVNDEIVHWALATDVDSSGASADLSGTALAGDPTSKTFTLSNLPGNATDPLVGAELYTAKGRVYETEANAATATLKLPAFTNAFELFHGEVLQDFGGQVFGNWSTFSSTAVTVDLSTRLLKEATSGVTWDQANKTADWTEATTGVTPEFGQADAQIFKTGFGYVDWKVVGPYTPGEVKFPTLPVETQDYNPTASDTVSVDVTVGKVSTGWDSYREKFFAIAGPEDLATTSGGSGGLEFQIIFESGGGLLMLAPLKKAIHPRTTGFAGQTLHSRN